SMALTMDIYLPRMAAATTAMCRSAQLAFLARSAVATRAQSSSVVIPSLSAPAAKHAVRGSAKSTLAWTLRNTTVVTFTVDIVHRHLVSGMVFGQGREQERDRTHPPLAPVAQGKAAVVPHRPRLEAAVVVALGFEMNQLAGTDARGEVGV